MSPRTFSRRGPFNTKRAANIEPLAVRIALAVHREPRTGEQLRDDFAARTTSPTDISRAIALAEEKGWIAHGGKSGCSVLWNPAAHPPITREQALPRLRDLGYTAAHAAGMLDRAADMRLDGTERSAVILRAFLAGQTPAARAA